MTYRDAIQIQIRGLQDIYDNSGGLRDVAFSEKEKEAYNTIRRDLPKLWNALQNIDNSITEGQASYKLKGDYSLKVTNE